MTKDKNKTTLSNVAFQTVLNSITIFYNIIIIETFIIFDNNENNMEKFVVASRDDAIFNFYHYRRAYIWLAL